MSETMKFDDNTAKRLVAAYRTPEVVAQRGLTLRAMNLRPGERVLDIGTGPGLLLEDIAATVGAEGEAVGVDLSEAMLNVARSRCAGMPWARFERCDATALPFADDAFDAAVATQVYEYVEDIPAALAELRRVVRPGGRVVIVDTDYDSWVLHTSDEERFARVRAVWDGHFVHRGLPRVLVASLRRAGFEVMGQDVIPMFSTEYHPHTYSYGMVQFIADYVANDPRVGPQDAEAWRADLEDLGERGAFFFSLNRYLFAARLPG